MQEYGMLKDEVLVKSDVQLEGYKLIIYADVPEFDQTSYYVKQGMIVEQEDFISIGAEIVKVEVQIAPTEIDDAIEFVENPPWEDKSPTNKEIDALKGQLETVQGALDFIIMNY